MSRLTRAAPTRNLPSKPEARLEIRVGALIASCDGNHPEAREDLFNLARAVLDSHPRMVLSSTLITVHNF
jgi:hypothetical protein